MDILFLANSLEMGGIEKNLVRLTGELVSRGHKVIAASRGGSLRAELVGAGGQHVELAMTARPGPLARDIKTMREVLRREDPDIIHTFSATSNVVLLLASQRFGGRTAPVVSSPMGLQNSPDESRARILLRAYALTIGAERIIVTAPAIGAVLDRLPLRSEMSELPVQGVVVPRGDVPAAHVREELGLDDEHRVVLTIGRLNASKSHDLFIRAAKEACSRDPRIRCLIVGEGELRHELEEQIEALGLGKRVRLLGERLDIYPLLRAADVYVRPGVVEGFAGITVLEAQAVGVPVVAFTTEDVKLSITDGVTGKLVPTGSVAALADAILEILDDAEFASRLVVAARRHVHSHFGIQAIVDRLEELYADVAST